MHEPARQPRKPRGEPFEHLLGQSGAKQDFAHPHEQRERRNGPVGARAPERLEQIDFRRSSSEEMQSGPGDRRERDCNPHSAHEQDEQQREQECSNRKGTHDLAAPRIPPLIYVSSEKSPRARRSSSAIWYAGFRWRITVTHSSSTATRNIKTPTRKASCGIQIGILISPCATSLNCQLS